MINTTNNNNKNNKNNNKKKQQLQKNKLQKKKQQTGGENKGEIITYNILDYVFTSSSIHTMGLDWTNPLIYLFPLLQDGTSAFGQIVDTTIIGVVIYQVIYNFVFPLLQLVSNRISYIKTASTLSPHEIFSVLITGFKDSEEKKKYYNAQAIVRVDNQIYILQDLLSMYQTDFKKKLQSMGEHTSQTLQTANIRTANIRTANTNTSTTKTNTTNANTNSAKHTRPNNTNTPPTHQPTSTKQNTTVLNIYNEIVHNYFNSSQKKSTQFVGGENNFTKNENKELLFIELLIQHLKSYDMFLVFETYSNFYQLLYDNEPTINLNSISNVRDIINYNPKNTAKGAYFAAKGMLAISCLLVLFGKLGFDIFEILGSNAGFYLLNTSHLFSYISIGFTSYQALNIIIILIALILVIKLVKGLQRQLIKNASQQIAFAQKNKETSYAQYIIKYLAIISSLPTTVVFFVIETLIKLVGSIPYLFGIIEKIDKYTNLLIDEGVPAASKWLKRHLSSIYQNGQDTVNSESFVEHLTNTLGGDDLMSQLEILLDPNWMANTIKNRTEESINYTIASLRKIGKIFKFTMSGGGGGGENSQNLGSIQDYIDYLITIVINNKDGLLNWTNQQSLIKKCFNVKLNRLNTLKQRLKTMRFPQLTFVKDIKSVLRNKLPNIKKSIRTFLKQKWLILQKMRGKGILKTLRHGGSGRRLIGGKNEVINYAPIIIKLHNKPKQKQSETYKNVNSQITLKKQIQLKIQSKKNIPKKKK